MHYRSGFSGHAPYQKQVSYQRAASRDQNKQYCFLSQRVQFCYGNTGTLLMLKPLFKRTRKKE
jgi:hypothetical protein